MKVYILLGDEPRSDNKNIIGVFSTSTAAKMYAGNLSVFTAWNVYEYEVKE